MESVPAADATTEPSRPNSPFSTPGSRVICVTRVTLSLAFFSDGTTNTPGAVRDRYVDALTLTAAVDVDAAAAVSAAVTLLLALLLVTIALLLVSFVTGISDTPDDVTAVWLSVHVYVVKLIVFRSLIVIEGIAADVSLQPLNDTVAEASTFWGAWGEDSGSAVAKLTTCTTQHSSSNSSSSDHSIHAPVATT